MFAGQGSIRQQVMGTENRKATAEEIEKMKEITRQAMLDGALGLSTGRFLSSGNFTPTEEVIEMAKVAAQYGQLFQAAAGLLARSPWRTHSCVPAFTLM